MSTAPKDRAPATPGIAPGSGAIGVLESLPHPASLTTLSEGVRVR